MERDDESFHTANLHKLVDEYQFAMASSFRPNLDKALEKLDAIIARCTDARALLLKQKDGA
jgi:hypothetical protein